MLSEQLASRASASCESPCAFRRSRIAPPVALSLIAMAGSCLVDLPRVTDNPQPVWRRFCPPGDRRVTEWLRLIRPTDAPVAVIDGAWIAPAVGEVRIDDRPAPAHTNPDGRDPAQLAHRAFNRKPQKATIVRAMAVAYWVDLEGMKHHEAAQHVQRNDWQHPFDMRSRAIERLLGPGRELLHALGAWPWSIESHPPRDWRTSERYATALAFWHFTWWTTNYVKAQQAAAAVAGAFPSFLTPELQQEAQARYYEAVERWGRLTRGR